MNQVNSRKMTYSTVVYVNVLASILLQLILGIRFFDIRVKLKGHTSTGRAFYIMHNRATFKTVKSFFG